MRNSALDGGAVKRDSQEIFDVKDWQIARVPLSEMCLRINGYLNGAFSRGARFIIWDKHRFFRGIRSGKARKVSHIEQAMTVFRKTSTNWVFQDIWVGARDKNGVMRRHRRIKILPAGQGTETTQLETTIRFLAYVTSAARMNRSVRVDRPFLVKFWQTTGLPEEWIRIAWQRMKKIRGYRVKWKGVGAGRKAVVSLPHNRTRSSSPYGEKIKNSDVVPPSDFPPGKDSAPVGAVGGETPTPLPPPRGAGNPPATAPTGWGPPSGAAPGRGSGLRFAVGSGPPPIFVAGRWISSRRTLRKAAWLAVARMRSLHDGFRVRWRFAHCRNFAFRALRDGFSETAILGAWSAAIRRSHEDACDHDLRERPDPTKPHPLREPSAAVVYAWVSIRSDKRSPQERWTEIFATPRQAPAPRTRTRGASPSSGPRTPGSQPGPVRRSGARVVRGGSASAITDSAGLPDAKVSEQRTIEAHLTRVGITLQDLLRKSRPDQAQFFRDALAAQKNSV